MNIRFLPIRKILFIAGLLVLMVLVMDFNARMEKLDALREKAATVQAEATQVSLTQIALQTQIAEVNSDEFTNQWGNENPMYIMPGDHPLRPQGNGDIVASPTPTPSPSPTPLPNWKIWWDLFFGP
jgi:hypothetical protein